MKAEPTENDSVGYYERTATVIVKDDGSKCVDVGLVYQHDDEEIQYILHEILTAMGRIEMDISCDRKSTVDAFIENQRKNPQFVVRTTDPTPPRSPETVREALRIAVYGANPELSDEEFESLYEKIWKTEKDGKKESATIINDFMEQRKHD